MTKKTEKMAVLMSEAFRRWTEHSVEAPTQRQQAALATCILRVFKDAGLEDEARLFVRRTYLEEP